MTKAELELILAELLRHAGDTESGEAAITIVEKALKEIK
jgi:hypothetical protein